MAKSFLGAQLEEIPHLLDKIGPSLQKLAQVNAQVLSRKMGVVGAGGSSGGGGGGPVLVTPSGQPIPPTGGGSLGRGGLTVGGISGIAGFLEAFRLQQEAKANQPTSSSGQGGGGGRETVRQPSKEERAVMLALGEGVDYVRKLAAACKWSNISWQIVIAAPKGERDALIAAYEAYVESTTKSSTSTKGSGNTVPPREVTTDNLGNYNTADANRGRTQITGPYGANPPDHSSLAALAKMSTTPTAGDKFVAEAVSGVTKAIDKLSAKLDTGGNLAFRTKGL